MSIKKMGMSWIVVSDFKKAVDFYTKTLGLKLNEMNEEYGWAEVAAEDGGSLLGIAKTNDVDAMAPGTNAVVTMSVDNIEEAKKDLQSKNVTMIGDVIEVPGIVKLQTFKDEDGNSLQLVEHC